MMNEHTAAHVVLAGGSGLIGRELAARLRARGTRVTALVRRPARSADEVSWSPGRAPLDPHHLAGATAVISLNGASVGKLPWSRRYRDELLRSRVLPTRTLAIALAALGDAGEGAPSWLSASAVGFYGSAPGATLTESAGVGTPTFLSAVCEQWEAETRVVTQSRVALLRTAPVIDAAGVLKPQLRLANLGLAGPLGGGQQYWPWISLTDEVNAILHVLDHDIAGPVNLVGPTPATANETGRALAAALHRPFWLPAPAFALRAALGPAADSLLLSDARVVPEVLQRTGFTFAHETVEAAVNTALSVNY